MEQEIKKIVDQAFDSAFDWKIYKLKDYNQKEMERDIKMAIKTGIEKYITLSQPDR